MSVALEEGNTLEERSRCVRLLSILFPLASLMVLLVGYAALGALLFRYIEGPDGRPVELQKDYKDFLLTLVKTVRNSSENDSSPEQEEFVMKLHGKMKTFNTTWLQSPEQWSFFGAMFFCCTVFTTVGYGNIYPVTVAGKLVCVLYAMVGIPLMLLVITDVGDILAILVSKAYLRLHRLCCSLPSLCSWFSRRKREKPEEGGLIRDTSGQDGVVVRAPMDIRQVLRSQASVKTYSVKLCNAEIFDLIVARDNLASLQKHRGLYRSYSCPNLNQTPPQRGLWDLCTGEEVEKLDVPLMLILVLFFAYLLFGGLVLPRWEEEINIFDAFYFCFVTLTTIGFGDIVPQHPKFFMLTFLFIIAGMAILSMAFKLGQSRFVSCYRLCIRGLSGGTVLKYK
ncbi:potassium channel subfamily K member 18 [Anguilla rostrata]|uniref:potassium channel subfamily K member 18 n=1 Tax=Anguilla rostrata TaxID=7938 RepID=UPI0030CAA236